MYGMITVNLWLQSFFSILIKKLYEKPQDTMAMLDFPA